eukprot:800101-Pleurochrysis_carterae.AAC.3
MAALTRAAVLSLRSEYRVQASDVALLSPRDTYALRRDTYALRRDTYPPRLFRCLQLLLRFSHSLPLRTASKVQHRMWPCSCIGRRCATSLVATPASPRAVRPCACELTRTSSMRRSGYTDRFQTRNVHT